MVDHRIHIGCMYWNWVPRSSERDDPPPFLKSSQPAVPRSDHILPTDWSCQHMSARLRASMIGPPIKQKNTIYFNQQMEVNMKCKGKSFKCCSIFFFIKTNS